MRTAPHCAAAILSIGDELVLGEKLDTNSRWIAARLGELGVPTVEHVTAGDDEPAIAGSIDRLAVRADLIIATGGLGPTADDLTRQGLARSMRERLVEDAGMLAWLSAMAAKRGRSLELYRMQAQRPESAVSLANPWGTAPGMWGVVRAGSREVDVACLPGPPGECRPMFEAEVAPRVRAEGRAVVTRIVHSYGLPESEVGARLGDLMERGGNPVVGTTASGGVVSCRVRYSGAAGGNAVRELERCVRAVHERLGAHVFGEGADTLAGAIARELHQRGERLVVAESCTGGMLGAMVTAPPGAGDAFLGGWQTYSNEMKVAQLGVPGVLVLDPTSPGYVGAVSAEVARAMARGALARAADPGAQHALAITGIAGPTGATPGKPVGTVFIARARGAGTGEPDVEVRRFLISGDRKEVRQRSATSALGMLWFALRGVGTTRLTWEIER